LRYHPFHVRPGAQGFFVPKHCLHRYATRRLSGVLHDSPAVLVAKYFPNIIEHRDLINLTCDRKIEALYFLEPSSEHGPFLSQMDHNRLQEYHAFGWRFTGCPGSTAA